METLKKDIEEKKKQLMILENYNRFKKENPGLDLFTKYYQPMPENPEKYYQLLNQNTFNGFIIYCLNNLENIRKKKINTNFNGKLQVIYLDSRIIPHYEFIIRNNMIKVPNAKHTLFVTNNNEEYFENLKIPCLEIKKLDTDIKEINNYSKLLTSKSFWNNLEGEKILICQSDSIIFSNNIDKFIKYDYIGAPWLKPTRPNQLFQGNGGFSLRDRNKMIEIINKFPIEKMPNFMKPIKFMKNPDDICPEDVYFSQYILKLSQAILPDYETCCEFSMETIYHLKPFGGHKCFKLNWSKLLEYNKNTIDIEIYEGDNEIINYFNDKSKIGIIKCDNNELIISQNGKFLKDKFLNSEIGNRFIKNLDKGKVNSFRKKTINFNKVLIYNKRYDYNWRHFLTETFFDLAIAYQNPSIKIIISKDSPKHIYEIFTILNIKNYFEIDNNTLITCDELIYSPKINQKTKNIFLNDLISQSVKLAKMSQMTLPIKIFLKRNNNNKNYRYVSNQEELNNKIKTLGFYLFEGGKVPLFYQIALINQAKIIITQIGANCDNIIFCNRMCKFKIIYPFNCKKWAQMYQDYKQCQLLYCGNNYHNNGNKDKYNWNYTIDFSKFKL